jgi:hypothetical protein
MTRGREYFRATRADGRSDRRVVFELVEDAEPGAEFTYEDLIAALQEGVKDKLIDRDRVYRAVGAANQTLLKERKRYLSVIENVGYKVIRSDEHLPVALIKKDRAQSYLRKGIQLLRNARLDELSSAQRTLHEGQLMILGGLYQAAQESERRHNRAESLIDDLLKSQRDLNERLERLEKEGEEG